MQLRELTSPSELESGFTVLRELRTSLDFDSYRRLYENARTADAYTLVGLFDEEECVAVMGYRILHDFVHGKHLYIDDLVVTVSKRSSGIGSLLLKQAEKVAREQRCESLRLCTGVENEAGKRFYEREGWTLRAVAYKKSLSV